MFFHGLDLLSGDFDTKKELKKSECEVCAIFAV